MNPLISIVIPTYNRASLIIDALETCLKQTYRPLEIIVVDDGSNDDSVEIITKWKNTDLDADIDLKLLKQENKGGNVARNKGIKNAAGFFVAFLDSDDLWDRSKLEKQVKLLLEDSSVGAVYCGLREIDINSGELLSDSERLYVEGYILSQILVKDVTAPTSSYLVRKKVFYDVGFFDETLKARQDWDMWIRIAEKYKVKAVHENLMVLRHHSGIRTATNPDNEIQAYKQIRKKYQHLLDQQGNRIKRRAAASFYKRLGRVYFHHKNSRLIAVCYYIRSLFSNPKDFDTWAATVGIFLSKGIRKMVHNYWNSLFEKTRFTIRSH